MSDPRIITPPRRGQPITSRFLTQLADVSNVRRNINGGNGVVTYETRNGTAVKIIPRPRRKTTTVVRAIITSRDTTNKHIFGWSEVELDATGITTILKSGRSGTPKLEPAVEIELNPFAVVFPDPTLGDIVNLVRGVSQDGIVTWSFTLGHATPFACLVRQDGGVAGDDTTNCTFTYELLTFDNVTIATGKTPFRPRYPKTTYIKAPDFSVGRVEWFGAFGGGQVELEDTLEEIEDTSACA